MDPMQEEEEEGGGWLVSYADMMTLIACFFILMMAFANFDPAGFSAKADNLSKAFRKDKYKSAQFKLKEMTDEVAKHDLLKKTKISVKDSELIVSFSSSVLFREGKENLSKQSKETIEALIDVIKITNPNYRILIEGHSDDNLADSKYNTQWALSSARAAYVANLFSRFGFLSSRVVPIGRGDTTPVMKSMGEDGRRDPKKSALNRRVAIRLLEPYKKKQVKFGLGIYFKDATENISDDIENNIDGSNYKFEQE